VGPFTAADNEDHGQLWSPILLGDEIIIEASLPSEKAGDLELALTYVNHGYAEFGKPHTITSGSCNLDVVCPEGDAWRDQIRSVAVISTGGSTFCTGFLVNNTAQDLKGYFMTANHCGINSGNAPSLVTYWNYENSWCRPVGSPASGGPGDGTHIRITDWDLGTTEPGSSGSPLFDQNHRIIGQLHGGYAACGNNESDWYGRFYTSWTGGGSSSNRLSNWLDPLNTGQLTLDGRDRVESPFKVVAAPTEVSICAPNPAAYGVTVTQETPGYFDPVTLSVQGVPAGALA
jgi:hypothetical protein